MISFDAYTIVNRWPRLRRLRRGWFRLWWWRRRWRRYGARENTPIIRFIGSDRLIRLFQIQPPERKRRLLTATVSSVKRESALNANKKHQFLRKESLTCFWIPNNPQPKERHRYVLCSKSYSYHSTNQLIHIIDQEVKDWCCQAGWEHSY